MPRPLSRLSAQPQIALASSISHTSLYGVVALIRTFVSERDAEGLVVTFISPVLAETQWKLEENVWRDRLCIKRTKRFDFTGNDQGAIISSEDT